MQCGAGLEGEPATAREIVAPALGAPEQGGPFADRYTLTRPLGEGPTGIVHHATDTVRGEAVALKILHRQISERYGRSIIDDARHLTQIHHLKLGAVLEASQTMDGQAYVVTELLEGITLQSLIGRGVPQPATRVARIMAQICSALSPLHQMGRPHGNLKPSNVFLIKSDSPGDFVKITDAAPSSLLEAGRQPDRQALGEPRYFSPEQAADQPLSPASDQCSLAIIACQLLLGRQIDAREDEILAAAILAGQPATALRPELLGAGEQLTEILNRCLTAHPSQRFPDVRALARALSQVRTDGPGPIALDERQPSLTSSGNVAVVRPTPPPGPSLGDPRWLAASLGGAGAQATEMLTPDDVPSPFGDEGLEGLLADGDSAPDVSLLDMSLEGLSIKDFEGEGLDEGLLSAVSTPTPLPQPASQPASILAPPPPPTQPVTSPQQPAGASDPNHPVLISGAHDSADLAAAIAAAMGGAVAPSPEAARAPTPPQPISPPPPPAQSEEEDEEDITRNIDARELDGLLDADELFSDLDDGDGLPIEHFGERRARDDGPHTAPVSPSQVAAAIARAEAQESSLDPNSILSAISEELSVPEAGAAPLVSSGGQAPLLNGAAPLVTPPPEPGRVEEEAPPPEEAPEAEPTSDRTRLLLLILGGVMSLAFGAGLMIWAPWSSKPAPAPMPPELPSRPAPKAAKKIPPKISGEKAAAAKAPEQKGPEQKAPEQKVGAQAPGQKDPETPEATPAQPPAAPEVAPGADVQPAADPAQGAQANGGAGEAQDPTAVQGAQGEAPAGEEPAEVSPEDALKPAIVKRTEAMLQEEELGRELDVPINLRLITDPKGASIYIGEQKIGETPYERTITREGLLVFELRKEGYLPTVHRVDPLKIDVDPGATVLREIILESVAPVTPVPEVEPPVEKAPVRSARRRSARRNRNPRPGRKGPGKPPPPTGDLDNPYD